MLQRLVHRLPPGMRAFLRRIPVLVRAYRWLRRRRWTRERYVFVVLALVAVALGVSATWSEAWAPSGALVLTVLAGGLLLRVRTLVGLLGVVAVMLGYDMWQLGVRRVGLGMIATVVITAVLALTLARTRQQLGVQGLRGEYMLLELRDRLRRQGELPPLPGGWNAQVVLLQAGGSSFGGDFVVSACDERTLEVALVDVSGKGVDAGTRALMLSGAFGGLLGSIQPDRFLPSCNDYLHRQRWDEGFVTAVHLVLDLTTGDYVVESAGHPPSAQFDSTDGTWQVNETKGMVLGVVPELQCEPARGTLRPGDALLLYTDGLVEAPGRDLDEGIDRLLTEADRLVPQGFGQGAKELVQRMAAARDDDCALVLIWRS
ncbi:PP2C family protein-serine/threonine phosphatase [Thermomonospora cellulosilytica]|uniref:Serine phosphatase RsbU (Regulator of sigma subunit) n=1 Tax=Thermomonospora cellulosilytica TaxID=1411118 RepID=A0A7W3MYB6_9ACTN|nr:PP2C family protein-serine/threonine phosphatase [Thermomonospora cellulosilytica]MBA9004114.1 serine phosphatase RsbU (regulator of sigma subunit) [Thermomonospora cellulosilytica]